MKLYKFRPLGTCEDLLRLEHILNKEEFWFSSIWEQNDSLEGVYSSSLSNTSETFIAKDKYKICSFSESCAIQIPHMWAHYANGFKGVALEIEIEENDDLVKVNYNDNLITLTEMKCPKSKVIKIISQKTKKWKHECERRCIKESERPYNINVGKVTKIIFGTPFHGIVNKDQIYDACHTLKKYRRLRGLIETKAMESGLACAEAHLVSGHGKQAKVKIEKLISAKYCKLDS